MTLITNMYAGPSCGKSAWAAGLFYRMKSNGINAELLHEYAKKLTWMGNEHALKNWQGYIFEKQTREQRIVEGKVDICITDSPILLSLSYGSAECDAWKDYVLSTFNSFDNLNIFIKRNLDNFKYEEVGRSQKLADSQAIDENVLSILDSNNIPYLMFNCDKSSPDENLDVLYNMVIAEFEKRK